MIHDFVTKVFTNVNTIKKNPVYSAFDLTTGQESIRFGHTYKNSTDYKTSFEYTWINDYNIQYAVSYILHSSIYEPDWDVNGILDSTLLMGDTDIM